MKFTKEKEKREAYINNTKKRKTKFLWFPVTIDGETRWLETAIIEYKVSFDYDLISNKYYFWKPISFIDTPILNKQKPINPKAMCNIIDNILKDTSKIQENKKHVCYEASHVDCTCKNKCLRNIKNY